MEKFSKLESEEMNDAETAYYIDASAKYQRNYLKYHNQYHKSSEGKMRVYYERKNKLFIPYVITLIGTIMMFLLLVLPFTTATDEYAERLDRFADTEVYKGLSLTCADVKM